MAPLAWGELDGLSGPAFMTLSELPARLKRKDPWEGFAGVRQKLPTSRRP